MSNVMTRKQKVDFFGSKIEFTFFEKTWSGILFCSSHYHNEARAMNCISRRDDYDKNLFVEGNDRKRRWNLYSQIAIENDMLICANETYYLTDICNAKQVYKPCTLLDTNEVVDIGLDYLS